MLGITRARSAQVAQGKILAHLGVQASSQGASPAKAIAKRDQREAELQTPASMRNPEKTMNTDKPPPTSLEGAFERETAEGSENQQETTARDAAISRNQNVGRSQPATSEHLKDTSPEVVGSSSSAEQTKEQAPRQQQSKAGSQPGLTQLPLRKQDLYLGIFLGFMSGVAAVRQEISQLVALEIERRAPKAAEDIMAAIKGSEPLRAQFEALLAESKPLQAVEREARQVAAELEPCRLQLQEVMDGQEEVKRALEETKQKGTKVEQEWQQVQRGQKQDKKTYADMLKMKEEIQATLQTKLQNDLSAAQHKHLEQRLEQRDREEQVHRTFKVFGTVPGVSDKDNAYTQAQAALKPLGLGQAHVESAKLLPNKKDGAKPVLCFRLASVHHATEVRACRRQLKGKGYVLVDELTSEEYQRFTALRPQYQALRAANKPVWFERARLFTSSIRDGRRRVEELQPSPAPPPGAPPGPSAGGASASTSK